MIRFKYCINVTGLRALSTNHPAFDSCTVFTKFNSDMCEYYYFCNPYYQWVTKSSVRKLTKSFITDHSFEISHMSYAEY